jgi:hypothetical protein
VNAGVEWHIVPCIDPDGAILNEGWTQTAFTLANYMRNFHKQELQDQVEMSFPIEHKRLVFGRPVKEAKILQGLLEEIRPDFYHSLHNAITGGAFFCLTRDIHRECYSQLYELLRQHRIPLQENPPDQAWCVQFAAGVEEAFTTRKFYDFLEKTTPFPEGQLQAGACSWEYLTQIKPGALTFIAELPYLKHSSDGSTRETGENLRRLKLRLDAENKFLITVILEAWEKVKDDLNLTSPFYRKIASGMVSVKSTLHEGLPSWPYKTRDILFNPGYSGTMTEGERFNTYVMGRFYILCHSYEFVRLLKASTQTDSVREATGRLEAIFDEALRELEIDIDAQAFQVIDYDTLAKVQLGSGLIVLNSILAR